MHAPQHTDLRGPSTSGVSTHHHVTPEHAALQATNFIHKLAGAPGLSASSSVPVPLANVAVPTGPATAGPSSAPVTPSAAVAPMHSYPAHLTPEQIGELELARTRAARAAAGRRQQLKRQRQNEQKNAEAKRTSRRQAAAGVAAVTAAVAQAQSEDPDQEEASEEEEEEPSSAGHDAIQDARKLKRLLRNRVSAQQARERKKAQIAGLEEQLRVSQERAAQLEAALKESNTQNEALRRIIRNMHAAQGELRQQPDIAGEGESPALAAAAATHMVPQVAATAAARPAVVVKEDPDAAVVPRQPPLINPAAAAAAAAGRLPPALAAIHAQRLLAARLHAQQQQQLPPQAGGAGAALPAVVPAPHPALAGRSTRHAALPQPAPAVPAAAEPAGHAEDAMAAAEAMAADEDMRVAGGMGRAGSLGLDMMFASLRPRSTSPIGLTMELLNDSQGDGIQLVSSDPGGGAPMQAHQVHAGSGGNASGVQQHTGSPQQSIHVSAVCGALQQGSDQERGSHGLLNLELGFLDDEEDDGVLVVPQAPPLTGLQGFSPPLSGHDQLLERKGSTGSLSLQHSS